MATTISGNVQVSEEYLFEPTHQKLMVGKLAVSDVAITNYIESGENDVEKFSHIVSSPETPIEERKFPRARFATWELDDYRAYGRWLLPLVTAVNPGISHHIVLTRSYQLGAGPSRDRIIDAKRFGSVANFVKDVGLTPNVRYGKFDDWEFDDFVEHIKNVIAETGSYKITQGLLWSRINEGRKDEPSPAVIRAKTGDLSAVFKAAGIRSKVRLTDSEYKQIILGAMLDNEGQEPTAAQLDELSKAGKSHSTSTLIKHYGSLRVLKEKALRQYEDFKTKQDGERIKQAIESGEVPLTLFKGVKSGNEMISRFNRFRVIGVLSGFIGTEAEYFLNLCIPLDNQHEFISRLRKHFPEVQPDIISGLVASVYEN